MKGWVIAIGNTAGNGIIMMYAIGSVDQIKQALVEIALEYKNNDEENYESGTKNVSDVDELIDSRTNEVTELNAYNEFSDYHVDYTARRLDSMQIYKI